MKIAIDLGHGVGQDRGAEGFVTEESIIDSVGTLVSKFLTGRGHGVIMVRPESATSVSDSLIQRVDKANQNDIDLYVSIHANAGGGRGSEVFTYRGLEVKVARDVLNNLASLGFINRGIKSAPLYVLNKTEAPSMLIEICFTDTMSDVDLYNKIGAEAIANAITNGITGEEVSDHVEESTPIQNGVQHQVDNWILDLQTECNAQGFSNQILDGIPGPKTIDGCPVLKYRASGNITKLLQQRLVDLGYNTNGVDGIFGNRTRNAVVQFQITNGLSSDGIVGQNTWTKLMGI